MCTQKMRALSYIRTQKITFPPKHDRQTYRRTDINVYRVASLLKNMNDNMLKATCRKSIKSQKKFYTLTRRTAKTNTFNPKEIMYPKVHYMYIKQI